MNVDKVIVLKVQMVLKIGIERMSNLYYNEIYKWSENMGAEYKKDTYQNLMGDTENNYYEILKSYFVKREVLKRKIIMGQNYTEIAKSYKTSGNAVKLMVEKNIADLKMELAEKGICERIKLNEEEKAEYFYFRKRLTKKGITALHVVDEVDIATIAKYIKVDEKDIRRKIREDKKKVAEVLLKANIHTTNKPKLIDFFIELFDCKIEDLAKLPHGTLNYVHDKVMATPELFFYYVHSKDTIASKEYWGEFTEKSYDKVIDKLYNLQAKTKEFIQKHPDGVYNKRKKPKMKARTKNTKAQEEKIIIKTPREITIERDTDNLIRL